MAAPKRPLIQVAYTWREQQDPKDKPFTITNGGDDEARNVQIQPLHVGRRSFTFARVSQLLPGATAHIEPRIDDGAGLLFRTLIDGIEQAIDDRALEQKAAITPHGTPVEQFLDAFGAEKTARDEFEHIPVTVNYEDRSGHRTILEYRLTSYVFARLQSADLELVHEVHVSTRPTPFPPLRVAADEARRVIATRRDEGTHLFDNDTRFNHEMQERFFAWMTATGNELKRLFWSDEVSNWFHTGTDGLWLSNGWSGMHETRDDRLKVLDEILASFAPAPPSATATEYEYDVCLSFAGEQREYVERVAEALRSKNVRAFYDKYELTNLWGKDLYEHLNAVYRDRARFCVIFISREYAEKQWTTHERRSAQARAFRENREYILPARFDSTEIPGLNETIVYIDLRNLAPEAFADLILKKLNDAAARPAPPPSVAIGRDNAASPDMRQQLEELQRTIALLQQRDAPRRLSTDQVSTLHHCCPN